MDLAIFDTHRYDQAAFEAANTGGSHKLHYFEVRLTQKTAKLAVGFKAVCSFVNDVLDRPTLEILHQGGTHLLALRSAGYNHVDLQAAADLGIKILRVPEYSPYAVAEHTVALILALNRKICRSHNRVREFNFSLEGLVGFDLHEKTVGIIGSGRIGAVFARIMHGFGCKLLAYDRQPDLSLSQTLGVKFVDLPELLRESNVISLHVPLTEGTRHLLDERAFALMKPGMMLVNTGRGGLIDSKALISALKNGTIGYAGLDVYEEEEGVFFQDLSECGLKDDVLARLVTFPNVLITSHQAFLTTEALHNIATTTLRNVSDFEQGRVLTNEVKLR